MKSFRAERGHHDDRICALAFVLHSLHSFELTETDPSIAYDRVKRKFKGRPDIPAPRSIQETNYVQEESLWIPEPAETDTFDQEKLSQLVEAGDMVGW